MQSSHKHVYMHLNNVIKKNNHHHSGLHDSVHSLPGQDIKLKLPVVEPLVGINPHGT